MVSEEDLDFVSKEATRTKLRQSYFAKYVGEPGQEMKPDFVYGEEARRIRGLSGGVTADSSTTNQQENNAKTG